MAESAVGDGDIAEHEAAAPYVRGARFAVHATVSGRCSQGDGNGGRFGGGAGIVGCGEGEAVVAGKSAVGRVETVGAVAAEVAVGGAVLHGVAGDAAIAVAAAQDDRQLCLVGG